MDKPEIRNPKSEIFLGVDGGQSHTEAIIADERGHILARGTGGASNHAEQPGGRERLRRAVIESVGTALETIFGDKEAAREDLVKRTRFAAAHFGMTGGADYKQEIIGEIIRADNFAVGHDAPTALAGATEGNAGIVVIAGTGSVVYGANAAGETAQLGGLGYLFSDEGSGFWLAAQTIRLAIKERDGLIEKTGLERLVLEFFQVTEIRNLTTAFYNEKITRDEIAALAERAQAEAEKGNPVLRSQLEAGAEYLAACVECAAARLNFTEDFVVAGIGGMFRGAAMRESFTEQLSRKTPEARFIAPHFGPAIGALLLAYRQAGIKISRQLLANLKITKTNER